MNCSAAIANIKKRRIIKRRRWGQVRYKFRLGHPKHCTAICPRPDFVLMSCDAHSAGVKKGARRKKRRRWGRVRDPSAGDSGPWV